MIHLSSGVSHSVVTRFGQRKRKEASQNTNQNELIPTHRSISSPINKWTKGLLLLAPFALPNFTLAQEPAKNNGPSQAPQVQTTSPVSSTDTDFQKQLLATQSKIDTLDAALKSQKTAIEALAARLSKIEKEVGYEQFADLKQKAITKAQDATFILNLMSTRTESTPTGTITYMSIGKTISGTVVKDQNGKIALLTAWKPLKEAQKNNPDLKVKLVFEPTATDKDRIEADSKLLKNGTLKNYSEQFDIALIEVPTNNHALTKRLEAVALSLENYVGKTYQPGTEALAIGRPFGFPRYVTQGIISDYDKEGTRKHNSVSNQFPKLWTDTGIANGSEGGPLLGFNWEKKQWDVMGIVSSGTNEVMNYAVPVDVVSSFLQQRGYQAVDLNDPVQAKVVEEYHKLDQAKQ